jgi:glutamate-ammonia-ligase adenylyltransferase
VKLLSHLSPDRAKDGGKLPLPGDERLLALGQSAWDEALTEAHADAKAAHAWSETPAGRRLLAAIFGNSPFLTSVAVREWQFLTHLVREGADPAFDALIGETTQPIDGEDRAALMQRLRIVRRRVALTAALAELSGAWSLERQMAALTCFAEAAIDAALHHLLQTVAGTPFAAASAAPTESGLIVLGMGKLGGAELNYSSDIDLILLYDPMRAPPLARDVLHGFFNRLARELVRILDERTGDGYVFRTDLRLRPDPRSTPLVMSVAAALSYYESVGQNWERAALIKARPVAGDRDRRTALSRRAAALYLAQASRLCRDRRYPFDQASDRSASRRGTNRGLGPRHQDRPRRHPRNRVFRPDPAADLGRPAPRFARQLNL